MSHSFIFLILIMVIKAIQIACTEVFDLYDATSTTHTFLQNLLNQREEGGLVIWAFSSPSIEQIRLYLFYCYVPIYFFHICAIFSI